MLNVGLIGLGTVSIVHTRAIKELSQSRLVAICDVDESRKEEEPSVAFYTDVDDMLENEDLDVVHICLPHYLHDEAALKCVKAGVHVMLEKPVSVNYDRSRQLYENTKKYKDVKIGVTFQNRLNRTVIELKNILKKEQSKILAIKGEVPWYRPESYYTLKPWRGKIAEAGAGSIINQSIHTLDLLRHITGRDWVDCKALVGNLLDYDIEVEDTVVAHFNMEDNIKAFFQATNAYFGNDSVGVQVVTETDTYNIKDNKLFDQEGHKLAEDDKLPGSKIYYGPGHQDCIEQFYQAILEDTEDYIHLSDANVTMEMVDAIKKSGDGKLVTRKEIVNG